MSLRNKMVCESLLESGFSLFNQPASDIPLTGARVLSSGDELRSDIIWVLDNDNVLSFCEACSPKDVCLVIALTGHAAADVREKGFADGGLLQAPPGTSREAALTTCQALLTDYLYWKQSVLTAILEKRPFQDVLEEAARSLKNPLAVFDSNLFVLARTSFSEALPPGTIWDLLNRDQLFVTNFYEPSELESLYESTFRSPSRSALFHPRKDPDHTYYAQVLVDRENTVGAVGMVDLFAPITEGQIAWTEEIVQMLQLYLQTHRSYSIQEKPLAARLRQIAEKSGTSVSDDNSVLQELPWEEREACVLVTFSTSLPLRTELEKSSYTHLVSFALPDAVCFISGEQIHAVLEAKAFSPEEKAWQNFLSKNHLSAGVSFSYSGIGRLSDMLEQSRFALRCAEKQSTSCCFFESVYTDFLMDRLAGETIHNPRALLSPGIHNLLGEGDDMLVECLYTFLLNGRSIADTARAMYLHRNTLIYRLEKIENILGVELKALSNEELLPLLVSCFLLRNGK